MGQLPGAGAAGSPGASPHARPVCVAGRLRHSSSCIGELCCVTNEPKCSGLGTTNFLSTAWGCGEVLLGWTGVPGAEWPGVASRTSAAGSVTAGCRATWPCLSCHPAGSPQILKSRMGEEPGSSLESRARFGALFVSPWLRFQWLKQVPRPGVCTFRGWRRRLVLSLAFGCPNHKAEHAGRGDAEQSHLIAN